MKQAEKTIWEFGSEIFSGGFLSFCIRSAIIFITAYVINKLVTRGIRKAITANEERRMPLGFLGKIIRFVIYAIAIFSILGGIKPLEGLGTAILGATSVISVVIGLAAQETFGNFIAGFFLAVNQPFHVGDTITLTEKNVSGTVVEITFRHTVLNTVENTKVIVPNSVMNSAVIEDRAFGQDNYTKYISFDIGYDSDIDLATDLIQKAVLSVPDVIDTRTEQEKKDNVPPFPVRVDEFDASGIRITFPLVTKDPASNKTAASEVRKKLLKSFAENHIEIPYDKVEILHDKS